MKNVSHFHPYYLWCLCDIYGLSGKGNGAKHLFRNLSRSLPLPIGLLSRSSATGYVLIFLVTIVAECILVYSTDGLLHWFLIFLKILFETLTQLWKFGGQLPYVFLLRRPGFLPFQIWFLSNFSPPFFISSSVLSFVGNISSSTLHKTIQQSVHVSCLGLGQTWKVLNCFAENQP